ncbi:MAG: antibiotic biosynthesis monooxygenase, partial [Planctomicrobium sp.]|nr:antibiotic biosynthesis monooxygenase [Planctomicrobium sp.]
MAQRMEELASSQSGYLGIESVRDANGAGITISYWENLDSIRAWKKNFEHQVAQDLGQSQWYKSYTVKTCRVEDTYSWNSKT